MSRTRQFLVCADAAHADLCDQLVLARLETEFGVRANAWSEVYTDGTDYGILWGDPVSGMFGLPPSPENPGGDPSMLIVEDTEGLWQVFKPEPEPAV